MTAGSPGPTRDVGIRAPDTEPRAGRLPARAFPGQQYSRIYRARRELIDHILISHAMLATTPNVQSGTGVATGTRTPLARG
jgi:hypothetical protein